MIEDVFNTMKEVLELRTPSELEKQNGKYKDGITLENIAQILVGDETITEKGLPAIILRAEGAEMQHWLTTKKDVVYTITIGVAVTDTDEQVSQKRLWRTIRAIENALEIYLPGQSGILEYKTENLDYNVPLFDFDESKSTEKGGVITASVTERVDAYVTSQL